jgi:hypothetical protein
MSKKSLTIEQVRGLDKLPSESTTALDAIYAQQKDLKASAVNRYVRANRRQRRLAEKLGLIK